MNLQDKFRTYFRCYVTHKLNYIIHTPEDMQGSSNLRLSVHMAECSDLQSNFQTGKQGSEANHE
jgi:hypothetical protein